jgi:peptidoglycan DL-endopeptidase CwlO
MLTAGRSTAARKGWASMHLRRPVMLVLVLLAAIALIVTGSVQSVTAAPGGSSGVDDEGGTPALRKKLDEAARGYAAAKSKLDNSKKRQTQFAARLTTAEKELAALNDHVQELAATAYRSGRLSAFTTLLNSASPDEFLKRAETMDMLAMRDDQLLREYAAAKADATRQKLLVDNEIKVQLKQLSDMDKRKKQAEQALVAAGGGGSTGSLVSINSPAAAPAPRNSDGSWPSESCSVNDPTTSGCITPRMLHAYQEARKDGFTRYTSCHRDGGGGEHPKGSACDFSAAAGGFENVNASGDDRNYGDRLAAYFIKNTNALAVLYVIWYGRIWMPSTGWRSYSGCCDPAATHKNHVHLSVL